MNIVYAGAPEFSVPPLQKIINAGYRVVAVVTQPDKPVGRKGVITPTPLKTFAAAFGIPVLDYPKIRNYAKELSSLGADLMVTCAYGQLLTQPILDAFPLGVYNIHASLLPKYRGAAPIAACILNGETHTGITVMKTELGLDTGDMLLQKEIQIAPQDTAGTLSEKLSLLGGECVVEALDLLKSGKAAFTPQNGAEATLVKKINKEHALIDFSASAKQIVDLVRAMNPSPVAYAFLGDKALNVFTAEEAQDEGGDCGEVVRADKTGVYVKAGSGTVRLTEMQAEGGKRMRAADFVNGRKITAGMKLQRERV